ncbi:substrate-binding domain-containing protein [Sediminispirochaeta smaragdinae]|nr:LysR family transcriptional regulator [Sediminispirochaeta smaragdinae]
MGNEFNYALQEIDYLKNQNIRKLTIGSGLVWQYSIFPNVIQQFTTQFPDTQIRIITGFSDTLYEQFLKGQFDIIFCDLGSLKPMTGIVFEHLMNTCFSFFAVWSHPIFSRENITEQDLLDYDIAIFSHSNILSTQNDISDRHQIDVRLQRNIKYISSSMINLLEVVGSSRYLTPIPPSLQHIAEQFGLKEINPKLRRDAFPSGMVYRKAALKKPHVKSYIDAVRASIKTS